MEMFPPERSRHDVTGRRWSMIPIGMRIRASLGGRPCSPVREPTAVPRAAILLEAWSEIEDQVSARHGFAIIAVVSCGPAGSTQGDRLQKERTMRKILAATFVAGTALVCASLANGADIRTYETPDTRDGVKIGYLECGIGGGVGYVLGSAKELDCVFRSARDSEPSDRYTGTIRKLGVDLGFTTRSRMLWAVFAPTAGYHHGSLSGIYKGATAEATVGAGIGANILAGGTAGSIHLQTVSVTGQIGLNVAATGTSMTLTSVD